MGQEMSYIVYLAGPISNCSFDSVVDWREHAIKKLPAEILGLSPMRGKTYLQNMQEISTHVEGRTDMNENSSVLHLNKIMSSSRGIITRDYNDVRRSDALLVNLAGATKVSIGTVMEIGWAKVLNIPVICVMEEGNVHDHPMVNECIGYRCNTLDEGIELVQMLLLPQPHRETDDVRIFGIDVVKS